MIKDKKGFTLIEIVVALLITGIVLTAVYFVFIKSHNINQEQQRFIEAQDALRIGGLQIESDIRRSSQSIDIEKHDACYHLIDKTDLKTTIYCIENDTLTRNGVTLIDRINSIDISKNSQYIDIEHKAQYNAKQVTHEMNIFLRSSQ